MPYFDQEVEQKRAMANMLRQQSMSQQQGQMVSGHYVSPGLSNFINPIMGGYAANKIGAQADDMEKTRRSELAGALRQPEQIPQGIADPNYQPPSLTDRLAGLENNPQAQELATQLRIREATTAEKPQYRTLSPDQAAGMGLGEGLWQQSPDGQISRAYKPEKVDPVDYNKMIIAGPNGEPMINQQYLDASKEIRAAGATKVKVDNSFGGIKETFKNERDLRNDFAGLPTTKAFKEVQNARDQIATALSKPSAANDLAAATKFMKILDPGSVVRESELMMAMNATGKLDYVMNTANRLMKGEVLTAAQRADFGQASEALYEAAAQRYNDTADEYRNIAGQYDLSPDRVAKKYDMAPKQQPAENNQPRPLDDADPAPQGLEQSIWNEMDDATRALFR